MTLPKLPPPPRIIANRDGTPTREMASWMDLLYRKLGEAGFTAPLNITGSASSANTANSATTANQAAVALTAVQSVVASDPTSSSFTFDPTEPLTAQDIDGVSGCRIVVAATTLFWPDKGSGVSYSGSSLTVDDLGAAIAYSTKYYVYCDDPLRTGGAVTWKATTDYKKLAQTTGRLFLDAVTTPSALGSDVLAGGGGGGAYRRVTTL